MKRIVLNFLCHYFTLFCPNSNNNIIWPQSKNEFIESYLAASAQLLTYINNILRDPTQDLNSTNFNQLKPTKPKIGEGIKENISLEEKLAVAQIIEGTLEEDETTFYKFSIHWNKNANQNVTAYSFEKGSHMGNKSLRSHLNFVQDESSLLKEVIWSVLNITEQDKIDTINSDTKKLGRSKNIVRSSLMENEFGKINSRDISPRNLYDIFYDLQILEDLKDDDMFNRIIESMVLRPESEDSEFETRDDIKLNINNDPNLMLLEIMTFFHHLQKFFENIEIEAGGQYMTNLTSQITINDIVKVLDLTDIETLTINKNLRILLKDILHVSNVKNSLIQYQNETVDDNLIIPVQINKSQQKKYKLSWIVDAILKEETKNNKDVSVTTFGNEPNNITIVSGEKLTVVRHESTSKPSGEDSVEYILSKLSDLLYLEGKVRKLHKTQGFTGNFADSLRNHNFNSSAQQLKYTLDKMIKRKDSVWIPCAMLSAFIEDELSLAADSSKTYAGISETLSGIPPLDYF